MKWATVILLLVLFVIITKKVLEEYASWIKVLLLQGLLSVIWTISSRDSFYYLNNLIKESLLSPSSSFSSSLQQYQITLTEENSDDFDTLVANYDSQKEYQHEREQKRIKKAYLLILPYQGMTNQLYGILRGFEMARMLGRTLLIPPIIRSQHEPRSCLACEDWRDFISFQGNGPLTYEFMEDDSTYFDDTKAVVYSFGRWKKWSIYGETMETFQTLQKKKENVRFSLRWRPFRTPVNYQTLLDYLVNDNSSLLIVGQLQHVHFPSEILCRLVSLKVITIRPQAMPLLFPSRNYVGLHWRRGDFKEACLNKNWDACWPQPVRVMDFIKSSTTTLKTIWISSDDPSLEIDQMLQANGFIVYRSEKACAAKYFEDISMLIQSSIFIGNPYSTFSRLVKQIRDERNGLSRMFT